jgi:glutamate/tyrosine decarboxylase-like PLP-dependent enzyme
MSTHDSRPAPLAMDADTFKVLGHRLVDQLAELIASVPDRPVTRNDPPGDVRARIGATGPMPAQGTDADTLLGDIARRLFDQSLFNAHPRFFGYITAAQAPIGVLGDFIASALNANVGLWTLAPAATEIETQTVRWIAELLGFPADCGGLLVSGGNMANIVCLLAARAAAVPWDIRAKGIHGGDGRRLVAYASSETHTWIQKAADICGLGTDAVRWIPATDALQMDLAALRRAIDADVEAGHLPLLVVGTAGSVSTGVIDPLPGIAAICREKKIWFHVDAAYGGFALTVPDAPAELFGLREADSVAVDPHKWLYAPLEAGCVLVRDRGVLRRAFTYHPPYYHVDDSVVNYVDYGFQNSRGFRALKVWLALRQAGSDGYRQMIGDDIALSRGMARSVEQHPELELMTQSLSITTFRYVPTDLRASSGTAAAQSYLNDLNAALLDALQRSGEVFVSNAMIHGRYALRACIVNFHTSAADVEALAEIVVRHGRALHARMRSAIGS